MSRDESYPKTILNDIMRRSLLRSSRIISRGQIVGKNLDLDDVAATSETAQKELAELRKDAERYRWLMKDEGHNAIMAMLASLCCADDPIKPQMDEAIDAAMAENLGA